MSQLDTLQTTTAGATTHPTGPTTLGAALTFFLRQTSPRVLLVWLALAGAIRIALADWSALDLAPPLVILAYWPINEWLIHVFILHLRPFRIFGRTIDFRVPRSHREHHADPWKLEILFIPVHSFIYSLPLLVGAAWLLTPTPALAATAVTLYIAMALHYEWVHFLAHTRYAPRSAYYDRVVRNHRLHHFKNEHYWYGVSMLGGDRLLGTNPAPETAETSPTCRTLGVEPPTQLAS